MDTLFEEKAVNCLATGTLAKQTTRWPPTTPHYLFLFLFLFVFLFLFLFLFFLSLSLSLSLSVSLFLSASLLVRHWNEAPVLGAGKLLVVLSFGDQQPCQGTMH